MPVRDGRDVAASIKVRTGNVNHGVNRWIKDNSLVDKYKDDEDVLVYRHEDLVKNPEVVLRKVCRFLELEFSPDLLNYHEKQDVWTGVKGDEKGTGQDGKCLTESFRA